MQRCVKSQKKLANELVFIFNKHGQLIDQGYFDLSKWARSHRQGGFFVIPHRAVKELPPHRDGHHRFYGLVHAMKQYINQGVVMDPSVAFPNER